MNITAAIDAVIPPCSEDRLSSFNLVGLPVFLSDRDRVEAIAGLALFANKGSGVIERIQLTTDGGETIELRSIGFSGDSECTLEFTEQPFPWRVGFLPGQPPNPIN